MTDMRHLLNEGDTLPKGQSGKSVHPWGHVSEIQSIKERVNQGLAA